MRPGDRGFPSIPGVKQAPQTPCSHDRAASTPASINFSAIVSPVPTATLTPDRAATTVKTSPCACRKSNPGCGEIGFPVLLVLGLGTRFAATGLLFMTFIVELTVPDGWPVHFTWAAMALAIMAWGPGRLSADQIIEAMAPPLRTTA